MSDQFDTGVVTIMFTDVEGSTDLTRRLGDEVARRTIEEHKRIIRAKLAEHDGREIDSIGDGFMITFLSTRRAVACAIAIHKALADHAREHPDEEVRVRIGLNVGEVLERGGHPFGAAVNATQRVAGKAKGGQIFVSEPVRHLAGTIPEVSLRDRGRFQLKGFNERWRLYEVDWERPKEKPPPKRKPEPAARRRRRRLFLAGVLAGAIVLALAAFLILRGGAGTLDRVAPNSVGIIDPDSGGIIDQVPVGRTPQDIAFGEGALWVANLESGTISEIDPDSREEVATFNAGTGPRGIAAGEGAVWVANGFANELTIFDPAQDRVDDRVPLAGPRDVAVDFGAAWVANVTDTTVVRIDPDTHDPERIAEGTALALGPNALWIANGKTLRRLNPDTRDPVGRPVTLRSVATKLTVDENGVVWVTHQGDDAVSRVDPTGGASQIEGVGDAPTGIAVGEGSVWVASSLGRSLIKIGPKSRKVEQTIPLGSSPAGVVVAAGHVWVTTGAS
jgi:YVTN family beta-propeller protein